MLAQLINRIHGGTVIAAWEIDELDDATLDVFRGLVNELPDLQQAEKATQAKRLAWLSQHPTYRHFGLEVKH